MKVEWTKFAVVTLIGIVATVFEIVNVTREIMSGLAASWFDFLWTGLAILSIGFDLYEMSDRLHDLTEPQFLRPILASAFRISTALAFGGLACAWWETSGYAFLAALGALILAGIFGACRNALDPPPDLFEWAHLKTLKAEWERESRERTRAYWEHQEYLKSHPAEAALERMPLCVRVRCGL